MVATRQPGHAAEPVTGTPTFSVTEEQLLQALGVAVYTTDAAGRITFYNDAAAELWGRRPELGVDLWCGSWHLLKADGTPMAHDECPMAITLREQRPVRGYEAIAERPDGTRVNFMPFPTPIFDASGRLVGAVNVLVDITRRRRAEADANRQRDLIKTITDNMSVGLVMVDCEGRVEFMNPAAEVITGFRFEQLRGERLYDKVRPPEPNGNEAPDEDSLVAQAVLHAQTLEGYEDVFVRPDGSSYNVICNIAPILRYGESGGAVIDLRDATEEKQAEEAIRQSMALKDQFLGLVSHELRTPIATIVGNAILLQRRSEALPPESKEQALGDIAGESQKLQRIIENLLLITRMEAGRELEAEPIRLPVILSEAVSAFRRRRPQRPVSIETDGDVPIALGNSAILPLVFDNLVSNADKRSTRRRKSSPRSIARAARGRRPASASVSRSAGALSKPREGASAPSPAPKAAATSSSA
jgi:PAS domain S-box-containing protein